MKNFYIKILLLIAFAFFSHQNSMAQKKRNQINRASFYELIDNMYKQGKFAQVCDTLEVVLNDRQFIVSTPAAKRADLCKYLAASYIYLRAPEKTNIYLEKMLEWQPDYKINGLSDNDLQIMRDKISGMYVTPGFAFGMSFWATLPFVRNPQFNTILYLDQNLSQQVDYSSDITMPSIELSAEYTLFKYFSAYSGANFFMYRYSYNQKITEDNLQAFSYQQSLNYVGVPLLIRFYPVSGERLFDMYVEAGGEVSVLINAKRNADDNSLPNKDIYEKINYSVLGGAGIKFNKTRWSASAGLRYKHGLGSVVNPNRLYLTDNLSDMFIYKYYNIPDNFKLSSIALNFSLSYTLQHKVFNR